MDEARPDRPAPAEWPGPRLAWLLLLAAWLGIALVRVRLLDLPLERDEGEYAYFGQLLLRGFPPFRLAYTLKLPGTQMAYAAAMALFGQTASGIRLGLLLVNGATTALVFLLGKRLLGTAGAVAAGAAFGWLSASTAFLGLFAHATHFVLLPALGGLVVLQGALDSGRPRPFLVSGLLLGLALLMKQPGAVFLFFASGWLAWRRLRAGAGRRTLAAEEVALVGGAAIPLALVVAWVWLGGTLGDFWFWVVRYAREYGTSLGPADGMQYLIGTASAALGQAPALWLICGLGLALSLWPRWNLPGRGYLLGLLLLSFAGVSAGFYYRHHYFILLLPAAALLAGAAVRFAVERARDGRGRRMAAASGLAAAAIGCAQAAAAERRAYFEMTPAQVSRALYGANPFPESPEIARYIAARTGPDDRIAVLGSEPQIPFYARRLSATGHVYAYGLMEPQPLARAMQEQMAREIEAARPAYLVWVLVPTSWLMRRESDGWILDWADDYVARGFELVGQALILALDRTDYLWGEDARRAVGLPVQRVLVFRRRDFAPRVTP